MDILNLNSFLSLEPIIMNNPPYAVFFRLTTHEVRVNGVYGKVDNLHIPYDGNRMTGVLEDAAPVTQTYASFITSSTIRKRARKPDKILNR